MVNIICSHKDLKPPNNVFNPFRTIISTRYHGLLLQSLLGTSKIMLLYQDFGTQVLQINRYTEILDVGLENDFIIMRVIDIHVC